MLIQQPVIFLHIPKTAGKTLKRIVNDQYTSASVHDIKGDSPTDSVEQFKSLSPAHRERYRFVMGHVAYGLHECLPGAVYVTILRDPVERVISHYYYLRAQLRRGGEFPRSPWLSDASRMDLGEYVQRARSADVRNGQAKLLAGVTHGWDSDDGSHQDDAEILAMAKRNLRDIGVVGLTERFDETLILMKRRLGWTTPFYVKQNVTRVKPLIETISQDVVAQIRDANRVDLELYAYATQLFTTAIASHGPSFTREVSRFRFMNKRYGEVQRIRDLVRYRWKALARRWGLPSPPDRHR